MVNVLKLVPCTYDFWEWVRQLRNDGRVKDGFIQQGYITEKQQIEYMTNHSHEYTICLVNEKPAGYIGVIDNDIRICVHPDYQKMGVGKFMLINSDFKEDDFAKVKINNIASFNLFKSAGFKLEYYLFTINKDNKNEE